MGTPKTAPRTSYHHGDLRNALMDSAVELARLGGPAAVVLREVARRVGVSATAAYRHFSAADELVDEVKHAALAKLAESIERAVEAVPADGDPGDVAVARLRASAEGYLDFAFNETGLFQTAFCREEMEHPEGTEKGRPFAESAAFQMFSGLLDEVLAAGRMAPQWRDGAEIAGWSMVHGFAVLTTDGPLGRHVPDEAKAFIRQRTIDLLLRGLTATD
ncbi:TetR/AcrR family transcriptional regulator [Catenulispora subtropica]|uniref:TetR/AcrR family transcriptional regulator n=2 Tax=Catenulispora subtropica TaxID=450798 RepID=A0ABN2SJZ0_9ACTN